MKPVIYFLLFLLPAVSMAQQSNDRRTVSTKIADVLAKFPADNSKLNDMNVQQLESLGTQEPELSASIADFQADEREHRDAAIGAGAEQTWGYPLLYAAIRAGCRAAIGLSKRI